MTPHVSSLAELYHRVLQLAEDEAQRLAALPLHSRLADLVRRGAELRTPPIGMALTMALREPRECAIIATDYARLSARFYDLAVVAEDVDWRDGADDRELQAIEHAARTFRTNKKRCETVVSAAQARQFAPA